MRKLGRFILNFIKLVFTLAIVGLAVILFVPNFFDYKPLVVLSGSMEPSYPVGSIIYIKSIQTEDIEVGDVITYKKNMGNGTSNVTHRVTKIDEDNMYVYTKGDANNTEDAVPTSFADIIGKPMLTIPYVGYVSLYLNSQTGKIVGLTIIAIIIILFFLPGLLIKKEKVNE